jgi:hypothetical protein
MSWATCYSGSNNIHFNTPPLMDDGRMFTQFDPSCHVNNKLKQKMNFSNNYDYRQWLIKNGNRVADLNKRSACNECSECVETAANAPTTVKYLFKNCQDNSKPFGYESSDLKNLYLSKQALNARLKAPIITQEQLLLARASQCSTGNANSAGPMKSCSTNRFD